MGMWSPTAWTVMARFLLPATDTVAAAATHHAACDKVTGADIDIAPDETDETNVRCRGRASAAAAATLLPVVAAVPLSSGATVRPNRSMASSQGGKRKSKLGRRERQKYRLSLEGGREKVGRGCVDGVVDAEDAVLEGGMEGTSLMEAREGSGGDAWGDLGSGAGGRGGGVEAGARPAVEQGGSPSPSWRIREGERKGEEEKVWNGDLEEETLSGDNVLGTGGGGLRVGVLKLHGVGQPGAASSPHHRQHHHHSLQPQRSRSRSMHNAEHLKVLRAHQRYFVSVCFMSMSMSICMSIFVCVCVCGCGCVCVCVCAYVCVYISVHLSLPLYLCCLYRCLHVCLPVSILSLSVSVCLYLCPCLYLSVCISVPVCICLSVSLSLSVSGSVL